MLHMTACHSLDCIAGTTNSSPQKYPCTHVSMHGTKPLKLAHFLAVLFKGYTCTTQLSCVLTCLRVCSQGLLQRLGPIAAAAVIFLGGYGTGLASSNMYADIQTAEQRAVSENLVAPRVPVRQTSLTLPDKVCNKVRGEPRSRHSTKPSCMLRHACHVAVGKQQLVWFVSLKLLSHSCVVHCISSCLPDVCISAAVVKQHAMLSAACATWSWLQVASEQLATAQQEGLTADELSTIRVFQVRSSLLFHCSSWLSARCTLIHVYCFQPQRSMSTGVRARTLT